MLILSIESFFETFDWAFYIKLFLLGAFPWISQLRKLNIHFESSEFPNLKEAFNLFASIFSMSIFIMMRGKLEKSIVSSFPDWKWIIGFALISLMIFFTFYIFFNSRIKNGDAKYIIPLSLLFYIAFFVNLTIGFGILRTYSGNYVLEGTVIDKATKKPLEGASIEIYTEDRNFLRTDYSNENGDFLIIVKNEILDSIKKIGVEVKVLTEFDNYYDDLLTVRDTNNLEEDIRTVLLSKNTDND